jgi:hypothetical protein
MLWIVAASLAFVVGYATTDSFMYLIPAFLCFAIWIGIGFWGMMGALPQRFGKIATLAGLIFILVLLLQARNHWLQVDASHDLRAESFGMEVTSLAPVNAIVFANGDRAIFALWYFQFALQKRTDLAIIATDLLHFEWYQQMLHSTYPDLNLPGPFPFAETVVMANAERPVCYVEYIQLAQIACSPARDSRLP